MFPKDDDPARISCVGRVVWGFDASGNVGKVDAKEMEVGIEGIEEKSGNVGLRRGSVIPDYQSEH